MANIEFILFLMLAIIGFLYPEAANAALTAWLMLFIWRII